MLTIDLPSRDHTAIFTEGSARRGSWLKQHWDLLAVLLLVLGSFPTVWLVQGTISMVPNLGLIDDSWHVDSTFKGFPGY